MQGDGVLVRNNTSYPVQVSARLRDLFLEYKRLRESADASEEARTASALKYYQYLVRTVMTNPEYGIGECGNARGLLIYHTMGMGKTFLAVAAAMAMWDVRAPVLLAPKSLQKNFRQTVEKFVEMMATPEEKAAGALDAKKAEAVARFRYVSLDAYNMATQIARATSGVEGSGTLNNRLLIVDEAHNLFRGIINSPNEKTNARRLYEMVMEARNLRILFLTGTVPSKDPFELVPCFNMLAGYDLLPTQYDVFYKHYVETAASGARVIRNRGKLANRLMGLVSHATHTLPSDPGAADTKTSVATGADADASARGEGGFPEELETIIERIEMSPEQYRQYLLAREKEEAEGKGGEGGFAPGADRIPNTPALALPGTEAGGGSTYYVKSRSLGNFAPPRDQRDASVSDMTDDAFGDETSPKASRLVANLATSPGPVLIYSQFVDIGGLAVIARFLRKAGYTEYHMENLATRHGGSGQTFSSDGQEYDVESLWRLTNDLPVEEISIDDFVKDLDEPVWSLPEEPDITPRMVLDNPFAHHDHSLRIDEADMTFPILLVRASEGYYIADGMHRLARAFRDGSKTIRVRKVPDSLLAESKVGGGDAKPKFAIISGDVKPEDRSRIQEVFNSPKNAHGELIKVLLVSKTGAEGLDLKGVRQVHIFEPYWDKSREDQVKARGVRLGSHDHLPIEEREVQPFLYITVANQKMFEGMQPTLAEGEEPPKRYKLIEEETIDEKFHKRALEKYALMAEFRRLLRDVCLECSINGYGGCRLCVPTDAPLFHEDPVQDLRLPDPCQPLEETEVTVHEISLPDEETTYFYREDAAASFGVRFFEYDEELEAHTPIDPSTGLFLRLFKAYEAL